jgi:hypothetical protein
MGAEPFFHIFGERGSRMWITFLPFYEIPISSIIGVLILFTGPDRDLNCEVGLFMILSPKKHEKRIINDEVAENA